jgi:hypothetical protein
MLRAAHVLAALVLVVSLWLLSIAGVSLLCVLPISAFIIMLRAWPAAESIAPRLAVDEAEAAPRAA